MTAQPALAGRRQLAAALAKAEAWLLAPVPEQEESAAGDVAERPVIAVVGLAPRCGATTVGRALGAELALRDPTRAAVVSCASASGARSLGSAPAARLARMLDGSARARMRPAGRLCLVESSDLLSLRAAARYLAPLIVDVSYPSAPGPPASLADHVVLVASPEAEPPLASVVAESLGHVGPEPMLVVNRDDDADRWTPLAPLAPVFVADSRAGAHLALAGRDARRALGPGIVELADRCRGLRCD